MYNIYYIEHHERGVHKHLHSMHKSVTGAMYAIETFMSAGIANEHIEMQETNDTNL